MNQREDRTRAIASGELERIIYGYSEAWEGKLERAIELGDALVRAQPTHGTVMRVNLAPVRVDERLDALIAQVAATGGRCLWIVGPGTRPADLGDRLMRRGFTLAMEFEGLVLDDLSIDIARNPAVVIEPLSWDNAEAYATRCTDSPSPRWHQYLLTSAHRYVEAPLHEVQIYIASLDGEVAGYAVLRIEPTGIAYFQAGLTVKEFGLSTLFKGKSPLRAVISVGSVLGTVLERRSSRNTRRSMMFLRRVWVEYRSTRAKTPPNGGKFQSETRRITQEGMRVAGLERSHWPLSGDYP